MGELCLDHGHGHIASITYQGNDPRGQDIAGSWGEERAGLVRLFDRLLAFEGLRPAEWWSFLDTVRVSSLIMLQ